MYSLTDTEEKILTEWHYHKPNLSQTERFPAINDATREAAKVIMQCCPPSPERTLAIRKLQEARMWANASIVMNEKSEPA